MKVSFLALLGLLLPQFLEAGEVIRLKSVGDLHTKSVVSSTKDEGLFFLQWKGAIREEEKAQVQKLGIELLQYFPEDAFLVKSSRSALLEAEKLSFISGFASYEAGMKLEREISEG